MMKNEKHKTEIFMEELASKKNLLAMTYLAILKDAPSDVKNYWFDQFEKVMETQPRDEDLNDET